MSNKAHISVLKGLAVSGGLAEGPAFIYRGDGDLPIPEYRLPEGGEDAERLRLERAIAAVRRDLENFIASLRKRTSGEEVKVFECHLMMMEDEVFTGEMASIIEKDRINAESAVRRAVDSVRTRFSQMNDPYFRERVRDLDDVERRLQRQLSGRGRDPAIELNEPSIIVADDLTPSETVQLPQSRVLGFVTDGGSVTSHVALLARSLGIPAVAALGDITSRVSAGDTILLDGGAGTVVVDPGPAELADFRKRSKKLRESPARSRSAASPGVLADGSKIGIFVNAQSGMPADAIVNSRADGIGLYRSEYLWIGREVEPSEDEQFEAYRDAVLLAGKLGKNASVTIRTLDIGGDKTMLGGGLKEANPFLGNRSIRYLLSHRDMMLVQLMAILRASAYGKVRIMHPMISCVEELEAAAEVLEEAKRRLASRAVAFDPDVEVGAMIEVPSAALIAEDLAGHCDFFSIGTNDLVQYTMAADRGNDAVAHLYQPLNLAIVKLVSMAIAAAKKKGLHVTVCGESASSPVEGTLWAALGVDALSMSPNYVPVLSAALSRLTRKDLDEYAKIPFSLPAGSSAAEIASACRKWLEAKAPGAVEAVP